jgi:ribulose-phosphate 3-epimerase
MTKVLPAIIPHTKEQLEGEIKKVVGFTTLIQVDISDGVFVPTKTWPYNGRDPEFFEQLKNQEVGWPRWEDVDVEIHLMVKNPEETVLDWIHTGVSSVVAHIEATDNFQKVIDICRENSVSIGVAIKPSTDIEKIKPFVDGVDFIQVMGSDILGKHDVPLDPKAIEMITQLRALYPERIIAIDIGVTIDTKDELISAGANKLISGGAILEDANPEEVYRELEQ